MGRKIISCSACNARFDVTKYPAGSRVRCGRCSNVLVVPEQSAAPKAAPRRRAARGRPPGGRDRPAGRSAAQAPRPANDIQPPRSPAIRQRSAPPISTPISGAKVAERDPLLGQTINNIYKIIRKLGEGGYGAVYEATDVNLQRRIAVKVMLQSRAQNKEYVAKFLREARTAAQLSHPNVVAVHGVGYDRKHGVHFLAMEYVEGRTLHDVLQERGPLPVEEAVNYMIQSCKGLAAAHDRNIIHRDIKPGNLMITPDGSIKIADFGLAKVYDPAADQSTVIGTPYFMPPEQFEGKAKDGRTDIYALGVTFYYMLSMQRPHTGSGPAQILLSIMTKEPKSVLEHRSDLPEGIWPVVKRMIHRDLDTRYSQCGDIVRDLEQLIGGGADEDDFDRIYCAECGTPNDVDAAACTACQASLLETCPVCGAEDMAGTKFCGDCGANIPQERAVLALVEEARQFLDEGQIERATSKLTQASDRSPENKAVVELLGALQAKQAAQRAHLDAVHKMLEEGHPAEAAERTRLALREFPGSTELQQLSDDIQRKLNSTEVVQGGDGLEHARHLEAEGRYRDALVAWRTILVLSPDNGEAQEGQRRAAELVERAEELVSEATKRIDAGDPEVALAKLKEANSFLPKDPIVEGRLEEAERLATDLRGQLDELQGEIEAGSNSPIVVARLKALADRYPGSQELAETLEEAESAGRQASAAAIKTRLKRLLATASAHEERHELRDALRAYREAAALDAEEASVSDGLARVRRQIAEFDALVSQSRNRLQAGDPERAVSKAEEALELIAGDAGAEAQLARSRTTVETLRAEAERIRSAIETEPDDDVLNWARDLATRFTGSTLAAEVLREAEHSCRKAEEEANREQTQNILERGARLEEEGNHLQAKEAFEEALQLVPDLAEAKEAVTRLSERIDRAKELSTKAEELLAAGDPDGAAQAADESLELLPDQPGPAGVRAEARTAVTEIERAERGVAGGVENVTAGEALLERMQRLHEKYSKSEKAEELVARAQGLLEATRARAQEERVRKELDEAGKKLDGDDLPGALAVAQKVIETYSDNEEARAIVEAVEQRRQQAVELAEKGKAATEAGDVAAAVEHFDAALERDRSCDVALAGKKAVEKILAERKGEIRQALELARTIADGGDLRDAIEAWRKVAELDPQNPDAASTIERLAQRVEVAEADLARGRERLEAGDPEAAVAPLESAATTLRGKDAKADLDKAQKAAKKLDTAAKKVEAAIAADEPPPAKITKAAEKLAADFPGSPRATGLIEEITRRASEAQRAAVLAKIAELASKGCYGEVLERISAARADGITGPELDAAEKEAREAREQEDALRVQADELRSTGKLDDARKALASLLALRGTDDDLTAELAQLDQVITEVGERRTGATSARRRGNLDEAKTLLEEAQERSPGDASITDELARLGKEIGERNALLQGCEEALSRGDGEACRAGASTLIERYPEDEDALSMQETGEHLELLVASLIRRAESQLRNGSKDAATRTLGHLLRIAPEHERAQTLRAQ